MYSDSQLNVYNAGSNTIHTTLANTGTAGTLDVFLVKYNGSGVCQWVTRIGGSNDDYGYSVSASADDVYVTGQYLSNPLLVYQVGGTAVSTTLGSSGSSDVYLVKYKS